ncbi:MAG: phosphatidate cytidylyltransferase [Planctomycetia bacterium]
MMSGDAKTNRIVVAVAVAAVFAALVWADATGLAGAAPAWWLLPVVIVVAIGGVDELVRLCGVRDLLVPSWLLRPAAVALPLAAAAGAQAFSAATSMAAPTAALGWAAVAFGLFMIVLFAAEVAGYRPQGRSVERLAAATFIVAYAGLPLAFMVGLRLLCVENLGPEQTGPGHLGIVPLVSLVAVVKAGDVAAYVVGSLFGRHRMAPILSPGKTWEGAAASLAGSLAMAWYVLHGAGLAPATEPWGGWATYGLAVGLAGMVGDLAESLLKREAGAKDSGSSLGGLGGVLDLVDSLLFAAPVAWLLWAAGR